MIKYMKQAFKNIYIYSICVLYSEVKIISGLTERVKEASVLYVTSTKQRSPTP